MRTNLQIKLRIGVPFLIVVALLGGVLTHGEALAAPARAPVAAAQAATLPATACTGTGTVTCNLWAVAGSITLPDLTTVTAWGYAAESAPSSGTPGPLSLPGPVLIVSQGDTVTVNLTNNLAEPTALLFQGQALAPDLTGVAAGDSTAYTFVATHAGTYLYEAGLLDNAQHQAAMGMYGTLVVRPATAGRAYGDAATAFDDETLVVLSEIDPALNNSATPANFDMRNYTPKYFLINGKAHPQTDPIATAAGNRVLLRYVNAGMQHHTMALLGLHQTIVAKDGSYLQYSRRVVAETIAPGETLDAIATTPATAVAGSKFALYDGSFLLHNDAASTTGGMLTFLTVGAAPPPGADVTGPATSLVTLTPNPSNGTVSVSLSAVVSDAATGNSNVSAAEYFMDAPGAEGAGTAMAGAFGSPTVSDVGATIAVGALAAGNHTIYVHGQDSAGNWGSFSFAVLSLDKTGPATSALTLAPNPSNGAVNVALHATGDDSASGGSNVVAAEYFIGADPGLGLGTAITPNFAAAVVSLDASIPAAIVAALSEGTHVVSVRSQDALGNWGAVAAINLLLDKTGPATSDLSAAPNPNNGALAFNANTPAVRVTATFDDATAGNSNIAMAEGFLDTLGANGTGFPFVPSDGLFNSPTEAGYADIPLATINALAVGNHTIYAHGKDAAGNWGTAITVILVIDKTKPAVSTVGASPNPTNTRYTNNTSFVLSASAADVGTGVSNIVQVEWYEGPDPGFGQGAAMYTALPATFTPALAVDVLATVDFAARGWAAGNHTLYVRARDAVGNWSLSVSKVVNVVLPNAIFSDGFEVGLAPPWTSRMGVNVSRTAAAAQAGSFGMRVTVTGNTPGYVTDGTPLLDASYHARFYFNPNSMANGLNSAIIFRGMNAANQSIFQVQCRRASAGGAYQVRLVVSRAGGATTTNWYPITNNAWHAIEIDWASGTAASARLYTDGTLKQTLTGLNTSAYLLDLVQLGPLGGLGVGASGAPYFDNFVSTRRSLIGL